MPITDVRSVLVARDPAQRNDLISAHMDRLEAELSETRAAVDSLRVLLESARTRSPIGRRTVPALTALAITDTIGPDNVLSWSTDALNELRAHIEAKRLHPTGPACGIFDESLYQQEPGQTTLFIPISDVDAESRRIRSVQLRAAELIVTIHHGSTADIDLAYADLGSCLAEHDIQVGHQIREHYLCDRSDTPDTTRWQTEIAWPAQD